MSPVLFCEPWVPLRRDLGDLERRVRLAVTVLLPVRLAPAELEDEELLAELLGDDLRAHLGAGEGGLANLDVLAVAHEEDLAQLELGALIAGKLLDTDGRARLDPVLLTA